MELSVLFPRFLVDRLPEAGETLRLSAAEAAHARARRVGAGDAVVLFDGSGREAMARVSRLGRSNLEVLTERVFEAARPGSGTALYVAGIRVERLSWIAEKATELGAARLVLVRAERTQVFRAAPALRQRLERVARAAAKQCGAARWPEISGPLETGQALRQETAPHRFLLDPEGEAFPSSLPAGAAALAVGPEGGWSRAETESARELGWVRAALPAGRLRAETAAIAGLVLLRAAVARWEQESSAVKAKP